MYLKGFSFSARLLGLIVILFCLWSTSAAQGAPPGPAASKAKKVEVAPVKGDGNVLPLYDELGRPMNQAAEEKNTEKSKQKVSVVCASAEEIEAFNTTVEEERAGKKSPYLARAVLMDLDPQELVARIKAGAGVNVEDPVFGTPLHAAISQARRKAIFQTLLEHGADPNLVNKISRNKETPLSHAISKNAPEVMDLLLKAGADPNRMAFGNVPTLIYAVERGKEELVQPLLDAGANPNVVNSEGTSALLRAVRKSKSVIQALLSAGAKADVTDRDGKTALEIALENSCDMETAAALLENGASGKTAKNERGDSLLHWAVEHDNARLLRAAIKAGVPLNSRDTHYGQTPLQMARRKDRTEMINILVDAGAR